MPGAGSALGPAGPATAPAPSPAPLSPPPGAKPGARRHAAPPLFGVRTNLRAGTGRLLGLSSLLLLFAAWCICSYLMVTRNGEKVPLVSHFFLPAPHEVLRTLLSLFYDNNPYQLNLLSAVRVSTVRIIEAFLLSIAVALPLGIFMGSFEAVNRFFDSIMAPLRYLPITAFIPLMILWFGIDETQKVAFLFLGTVVFLLPVVVDSIRTVPEEMVQTAFTLGASRFQVIRTVLIPAALPQIFDSFRVMNAIAWTYIILAEFVNSENGIGAIFKVAERTAKPELSFAGLIVVGVIGILTDLIIRLLNRVLFPWREVDV